MKPIDKFNRPIYPQIFSILKRYGDELLTLGWAESANKNLLFFKKFNDEIVFADMRGTEVVPIWDDPCPLIYTSSKQEAWKRRRVIRYAIQELDYGNIPHRFSFYQTGELEGLFADEADNLADGQCKTCRNEIDYDGLFCSAKCETTFNQIKKARERRYEVKCRICGKKLDWGSDRIEHHIDYEEDKTIDVCRSCHASIHAHNKEHPELAPTRPKKEKKPLLFPCPF